MIVLPVGIDAHHRHSAACLEVAARHRALRLGAIGLQRSAIVALFPQEIPLHEEVAARIGAVSQPDIATAIPKISRRIYRTAVLCRDWNISIPLKRRSSAAYRPFLSY